MRKKADLVIINVKLKGKASDSSSSTFSALSVRNKSPLFRPPMMSPPVKGVTRLISPPPITVSAPSTSSQAHALESTFLSEPMELQQPARSQVTQECIDLTLTEQAQQGFLHECKVVSSEHHDPLLEEIETPFTQHVSSDDDQTRQEHVHE